MQTLLFLSPATAESRSATVTNLLKDHDAVIRPNGAGPVKVAVSLYFEEATWIKNELKVYVYFRQWWNDARFVRKVNLCHAVTLSMIPYVLYLCRVESLVLLLTTSSKACGNLMWDTYFINAIDVKVVDSGLVEIKTNGDIMWSQGIQFSIHCPMDAKRAYDNDVRVNCTIDLQSYANDAKDVVYSWNDKPQFSGDVDSIISMETSETNNKYAIGDWAGVAVSLKIQTIFKKSVLEFVDETLFDKL